MTSTRRSVVRCVGALAVVAALLAGRSPAPAALSRGDADKNQLLDITDAINILGFLFLGGAAPPCDAVADVNADGLVDLSDPVTLLGHLFLGNPAPPVLSLEEVAACKGLDPEAVKRGMMTYEKPDPGSTAVPPTANFAACGTCHEMIPDGDSAFVRSGHSMVDALRRPSFKDGQVAAFLGAANVCRSDWMATSPWRAEDQPFKDLMAFLEALSPEGPAPVLDYEIACETPAPEFQRDGQGIIIGCVPKPPAGGSAEAGCELFNRSCAVCHSMNALGNEFLGPSLVDLNSGCLESADYIRWRIRRSGPDTVDNPNVVYPCLTGQTTMPFWSKDKLSDAQVADLIAYIARAREEKRKDPDNPEATFDCTEPPPAPEGKVIRRGEFTNARPQYGVSGFAEELDSRQVRLGDFSYLGNGIIVQVWLFNAGNIRAGVPIGPDLRRADPYRDETVVVDVPAEHYDATGKLKYDSVSIWCVAARVNFADAKLVAVP